MNENEHKAMIEFKLLDLRRFFYKGTRITLLVRDPLSQNKSKIYTTDSLEEIQKAILELTQKD